MVVPDGSVAKDLVRPLFLSPLKIRGPISSEVTLPMKPINLNRQFVNRYDETYKVWNPPLFGPDGKVTRPGFYSYPEVHNTAVEEVTSISRTVSSVSTRPWPTGKPTQWTNHAYRQDIYGNRDAYKVVIGQDGSSSFVKSWDGTVAFVFSEGIPSNSVPSSSYDRVDLNNLIIEFRKDLKTGNFNAGVALAEHKQTANLIATNMNRLASAFIAVKHGKIGHALSVLKGGDRKAFSNGKLISKGSDSPIPMKKLTKWERLSTDRLYRQKKERDLANLWLELQYGWKPLLSDVHAAVKWVQSLPVPRTRLSKRKQVSGTYTSKASLNLGNNTGIITKLQTQKWREIRSIVVEFEVANGFSNTLASLGLSNPLLIAWELVPYSFVVDWFLPVGNWLDGLDATVGLNFVRGSTSLIQTRSETNQYSSQLSSGSRSGSGSGSDSLDVVIYDRSVLSSFPLASRPSLKDPISAGHAANALALLSQSFLGKH